MNELWVGLCRFPGYEVSTEGRVRSVRREVTEAGTGRVRIQKGRILSQKRLLKGYPAVCMSVAGKKFDVCVHVLVAETFVGPKGVQVRHLDGNPMNNRPENLCWGTAAENAADRVLHGTLADGDRAGNAKLTGDQVFEIRELCASGASYVLAASRYGVSKSTVASIVTNKTWRSSSQRGR